MQLNELFDNPAPYTLSKSNSGYEGYFTVGDIQYKFNADETIPVSEASYSFIKDIFGNINLQSKNPSKRKEAEEALETFPSFMVSFGLTNQNDPYKITGTGNQHVVFSTALRLISDLVKAARPLEIQFEAEEPSRVKLYDRMVRAIASQFNFEDVSHLKGMSSEEYAKQHSSGNMPNKQYVLFNKMYKRI